MLKRLGLFFWSIFCNLYVEGFEDGLVSVRPEDLLAKGMARAEDQL